MTEMSNEHPAARPKYQKIKSLFVYNSRQSALGRTHGGESGIFLKKDSRQASLTFSIEFSSIIETLLSSFGEIYFYCIILFHAPKCYCLYRTY